MNTTTNTPTPSAVTASTTAGAKIVHYPADQRGHTEIGWLDSWHSFSFGEFNDPARHHFRMLRVINDDIVQPSAGFPLHPHRDMEIFTYVLKGTLTHQDDHGHTGTLGAGHVQTMQAGRGIRHSEYNASRTEPVHLLQIWMMPPVRGIAPSYTQKDFSAELAKNERTLIVSKEGREGSLPLTPDADVWVIKSPAGCALELALRPGRGGWLHVIEGQALAGDQVLKPGDAISVENAEKVGLVVEKDLHALWFDLA